MPKIGGTGEALHLHSSEPVRSGHGHDRDQSAARAADRRGCEALRPLLLVGAGRDLADRGRGRRGSLLLGLRRQALPRLRLAARQRLDRLRPPEDRRGDQGAGRDARDDRPADGDRVALAPRQAARRGDAGRPRLLVLHERRHGGERERDQARALVHGAPQDRRALPQLPRSDRRLDDAHRRPAPLARRARHPRRRADARPVHLSLPGRPSRSRARSAPARRTSRRS